MTREEKKQAVISLTEQVNNAPNLYIADASTLNVETINNFRRLCYSKDIKFQVVKNTLLKKAFEASDVNYEGLYEVLSGPTALMFCETANAPAKVLKEFREGNEKPLLKAALIDSEVYIGDDKINELASLKSREELIGDVMLLLGSPIKTVMSSLSSGGSTIASLLQTLSEKE